ETIDPRADLGRYRVGRKIISLPRSYWKDGRIRVDLSRYGKGEVVSRNRLNLAKRVREKLANLLAATDEEIAESETPAARAARVRNRHSTEIQSAAAPKDLDFIRPIDYEGKFSNCPRHVDRMIGPTHLQKRLFGFLWASAKYSGLKS